MRFVGLSARRLLCALIVTFACLLCPAPAWAYEDEPVLTEATAAYVMDSFGNVLYERNADWELPLASITKVMTAMVALDSGIPLDEPIEFVVEGYPADSQLAGYAEGDRPTFGELLRATLVYSANDAASNLAYAVAGSKEGFADLMNMKALEIGMTHTHFMNPHGLEEEGHYSCAADLCVMGRYAMEHYPLIRECTKTEAITIVADGKVVTLPSTDELMGRYAGLRGIKTGNTQSGASFLSCATNNHVTLYTCVLLCPTKEGRFVDTRALLDWGFAHYPTRDLMRAGWMLRNAPWADGFWASCPVHARADVTGRVFEGETLAVTTLQASKAARLEAGSVCGTTIWREGERYAGGTAYATPTWPQRVRAWNPYALTLFAAS